MDECAECRILSSTPDPVGLKLKVTVQWQNWGCGGWRWGVGGGGGRIHLGVPWTSDPSSQQCLGHLVFFSQPDVSKWISRTHSPVIGFWGKVLKLTLEKGGFLSSLIESAVVRVREQGRECRTSRATRSVCDRNFALHSVRSLKSTQPVTISPGIFYKSLSKIDPCLMAWFELLYLRTFLRNYSKLVRRWLCLHAMLADAVLRHCGCVTEPWPLEWLLHKGKGTVSLEHLDSMWTENRPIRCYCKLRSFCFCKGH